MLPELPAVKVEESAGTVNAPFKFNTAAPPDISITLVAAAEAVKVIPPFAFKVPVVRVILPILEVVTLAPAKVIRPETVADPELIIHELFLTLVVGCPIFTFPFTVRAADPAWVNELFTLRETKFNPADEFELFIVIVAPFDMLITGKSVELVPPIDLEIPVKDTVPAPPEKTPPLFVQSPPTANVVVPPDKLKVCPVLFSRTLKKV